MESSIYSGNRPWRSSQASTAGIRRATISFHTQMDALTVATTTTQTAIWSRVSGIKVFTLNLVKLLRINHHFRSLSDRVLDQLHETSIASSPKSVPTSVKSPSQEFNSFGSNHSSSNRWKRSSPDPNKMMMGRSPNVLDNNAKRILSTTPSRRASNQGERVGSPSLSGYPVRQASDFALITILTLLTFRVFAADHWMVTRRRSTTASSHTTWTTSTSTKRTTNTSHTPGPRKITATINMLLPRKLNGTRSSGTNIARTMSTADPKAASTTRASSGTSIRAFLRAASTAGKAPRPLRPTTQRRNWHLRVTTTTPSMKWSSIWARRCTFGPATVTTPSPNRKLPKTRTRRLPSHSLTISDHDPRAWMWRCRGGFSMIASRLTRFTTGYWKKVTVDREKSSVTP